MPPYEHTFLAAVIGTCIPDLVRVRGGVPTRRVNWTHRLLLGSFPLLAGYLAASVLKCESPLQALGLGLILDETSARGALGGDR
jgi:hypothetical protein